MGRVAHFPKWYLTNLGLFVRSTPGFFVIARGIGELVGFLPAFWILIVWVHDKRKSLLIAMIMHFSLTASTIIFRPVEISKTYLLAYDAVSLVVMTSVVGTLAFFYSGLEENLTILTFSRHLKTKM